MTNVNSDFEQHCENCEAKLYGEFCHRCGQKNAKVITYFSVLRQEFFAHVLKLDSKFLHTLFALYFRPGYLTREYIKGHRVKYTQPFRLFLFTTFIAIFVLWGAEKIGGDPIFDLGSSSQQARSEKQKKKAAEEQDAQSVKPEITENKPQEASNQNQLLTKQNVKGKSLTKDEKSLNEPESELETFFKKKGKILERKIESGEIASDVLSALPKLMLFLLPIFALTMKLLYTFSGRYYIEHLVYVCHLNAFIFITVLITKLIELLMLLLLSLEVALLKTVGNALVIADELLFIWLLLYWLISLRVVYGQSWLLTGIKFIMSVVSYAVLFGIGFIVSVLMLAILA